MEIRKSRNFAIVLRQLCVPSLLCVYSRSLIQLDIKLKVTKINSEVEKVPEHGNPSSHKFLVGNISIRFNRKTFNS